MKIVTLTPEAHGHVNPTLPLASELARDGHEVIYFLPETFASVVRANGAALRPTAPLIELPSRGGAFAGMGRTRAFPDLTPEQEAVMSEFFARMRSKMAEALPELLARVEAEEADCVIYDAYGFWIGDVARILPGLKAAFFPSFAIPDGQIPFETLSATGAGILPPPLMEGKFGPMPFDSLKAPFLAEGLNIVAIPRSFHPDPAAFDERYLFVGPSIRQEGATGDFPMSELEGRRVALISLGTGVANPAFFQASFKAFADTDWLVVAATGRTDPEQIGPLPANVLVRPHVPQLAILERADVFITHGGMNSTMEGLWYGVPLVVAPHQADQPLVAERVSALGLGRTVDPEGLTAATLKEAVDAVIADPPVAENGRRFRAEMREAGGARRAAAEVERFASMARELMPAFAN